MITLIFAVPCFIILILGLDIHPLVALGVSFAWGTACMLLWNIGLTLYFQRVVYRDYYQEHPESRLFYKKASSE